MRFALPVVLVLLTLGCAGASSSAPSAPPSPPAVDPVADQAEPRANVEQTAAAVEVDPVALYETCKDRVEGRGKDGECTTDADCAVAGCSGEVCLSATLAPEVMTTCEVKPCFAVLDQCGCIEGQCSWSLKDSLGPNGVLGGEIGQLPSKEETGGPPPKPPEGAVQ